MSLERCLSTMHPNISRAMYALRNYPKVTEAYRSKFIYFLIDGDDVVYVGKSVDVVGRVFTHRKESEGRFGNGKKFDIARYVEIFTFHDHDEVERAFIRFLRPKYNRATYGDFTDRDRALLKEYGIET